MAVRCVLSADLRADGVKSGPGRINTGSSSPHNLFTSFLEKSVSEKEKRIFFYFLISPVQLMCGLCGGGGGGGGRGGIQMANLCEGSL